MKRFSLFFLMFVFSITTYANKSRWDEYKAQWSELMLAIYNGQADAYNSLINQGVNLNYKTSDYKLSALSVAIYKEDDKAVNALVQTKKIKNLSSYLMTAAQCSNASTINILIEFGADPNMKNENGHTALMSAVSFGSYEVLVCLLKHGAKVNQNRKIDGMTPLMFAAFNGDLQKTKLLLEYHADKGLRDHNGKIALDYVEMIYPKLGISEKIKTKIRLLLTIDKKPQLLTIPKAHPLSAGAPWPSVRHKSKTGINTSIRILWKKKTMIKLF